MRKGQVEVIQVARIDRSVLEFRATTSPTEVRFLYIPADMEDGIRLHLVDDHKERKAAKKAERRFYVTHAVIRKCWQVRDHDREETESPVVSEHFGKGAEADARAFAKLLNKRNRKPMGGERDG